MSAPALEVRTLPIDQLVPAHYNPRKILSEKDSAYLKLRHSLETFGLVEPLVWNETTGRVVGGHARLRILRALGHTDVPVSVVTLNESQERALNVVLNNQEAQGRYDTARLLAVLEELHGLPEFDQTGFDEKTFDLLRYEPDDGNEPAASTSTDGNRVELTFVMTEAVYEQVAERLDDIVRKFDLESHLRRG